MCVSLCVCVCVYMCVCVTVVFTYSQNAEILPACDRTERTWPNCLAVLHQCCYMNLLLCIHQPTQELGYAFEPVCVCVCVSACVSVYWWWYGVCYSPVWCECVILPITPPISLSALDLSLCPHTHEDYIPYTRLLRNIQKFFFF